MRFGVAALRVTVGSLFMGHGLQKLVGWFGGGGVDGTAETFESIGLRPGRAHATAAGAAETVGGALLAGGLLTPLGASLVSGSMITAIRKVHGANGPWVTDGGYEYNLVLLAAVFAVADAGPGSFSLDERLGVRIAGTGWALSQLTLGALGSAAALAMSERQRRSAAAQPAPAEHAPEPDERKQEPTAEPVQGRPFSAVQGGA